MERNTFIDREKTFPYLGTGPTEQLLLKHLTLGTRVPTAPAAHKQQSES